MDNILKMAGFVALAIAAAESVEAGQAWLAHVLDTPDKWQLEADLFEAMTNPADSRGYTFEEAGRALYALMGKGRDNA